MDHQKKAIKELGNGKVLFGGVGSGKSLTALGYYLEREAPRDIYVITTAKKRDSLDWEGEAARFGIGFCPGGTVAGVLTVDSWNNIAKYEDKQDCFFIFDEQRIVGSGSWVKSFYKIAERNRWILLSATPGDTWLDYAPIFIANGFYKNITEFKMKHVIYAPFNKFPKVLGYFGEHRLAVLRNDILVEMPYIKHTERMLNWLEVEHDKDKFKRVHKDRWNPFDEEPIKDVAEMFRLMRRVVNSDWSRIDMIRDLMKVHPKLIVFYNFNYELEMLRTLATDTVVAEWNGHKKQPIPDSDKWVYLVQYVAGAEGWNCVETNAVVMYSMTYSYKNFEQCQGRIDRLNTKFDTLYYYIFVSTSMVDQAIKKSLMNKKSFNENRYLKENGLFDDQTEIHEMT